MMKNISLGAFLKGMLTVLCLTVGGEAFPSGAPAEACESLLPRHVHTSPKPATESPFKFFASSAKFYPDSKRRKIKVQIKGSSFKGFFVVAMDPESHQRIGSWMKSSGMDVLPCAAVTHADGRPKIAATLVWEAPAEKKKGEVIFMGTILESFSSYYSGLLASVPVKKKKKIPKRLKRSAHDSSDLDFHNATMIEYF